MRAGAPLRHEVAGCDDRAEGKSTAERLRERHHVRGHAELLSGEPGAGATEACLDLVEDQQGADARREHAQRTEERGRRRDIPAFAEHRLDEDRGDVLGRDLVLEHRVELREAMGGARLRIVGAGHGARERIRERRDVHLGKERAVAAAVGRLRRRERGGAGRPPVETAAEDDDRLAAGRLTGQLDRGLYRFRAAVAEDDRIEAGRRDGGERLGERDVRLVLGYAGRDVHEP